MATSLNSKRRSREGAIAVEMVFVLPIIFIFFFGLWEWSRVEMIRQVSETAAFEAARLGTIPGKTATDMEDHANRILDLYMISSADINATVNTVNSEVFIEVPFEDNTWISSRIFAGKSAQTQMKLKK